MKRHFNKNKTELICYPRGRQGGYTIPSTVTSIRSYAFYRVEGLTGLTLPDGIKTIGDHNIYCKIASLP